MSTSIFVEAISDDRPANDVISIVSTTKYRLYSHTKTPFPKFNLIYLAKIMERIPILPAFAPCHEPEDAGFIKVSDVFDVAGLSKAIGIPIVEWHEVKDLEQHQAEDIGCWSPWATVYGVPRISAHQKYLGLGEQTI